MYLFHEMNGPMCSSYNKSISTTAFNECSVFEVYSCVCDGCQPIKFYSYFF